MAKTKTKRPRFRYKIRDGQGQIKVGRAEAPNSAAVRKLLQDRGYSIISVTEEQPFWKSASVGGVSPRFRSIMYREIATMLKAGVSITQAIDIAAETPSKYLHRVLREVYHSLENGFALSVAMSSHPKVFPDVEVGVVRAGEATGNLAKVLEELSAATERSAEFTSRVRNAMVYPVIVIIVMAIVGVVILVKVIPPIKNIFESLSVELPWTTRTLLAFTDFLVHRWYVMIGILLVLFLALRSYFQTKRGKRMGSTLALKIPVFGPLNREVFLARFNRTLALLITAGVPIIQAVDIIAETTSNIIFEDALKTLRLSLEQGAAITTSMQKNPYFPRLMTQLLFVGQQSGDLSGSATTLANYYEETVDNKLRTLSVLIEPFIILALGAAVLFVILAVLQPIYSLTNAF